MEKLFTSESVTMGHPDKMCDLIADSILDAYLNQDRDSRVACEVAISNQQVFIFGEITSKAKVDIESLVRKVIIKIGYDNDNLIFNGHNCKITVLLNKQSSDIALGVNKKDIGAGDQGIMYGYATDEVDNYLPISISLAHSLTKRLEYVRNHNIIEGLCPDGKAQVTVEETKDGYKVKAIVISTQHKENKDLAILRKEIIREVIGKVINPKLLDNPIILINPTGRFVLGGPVADSGLTGRKIMVDTYGSIAHHGGGAFSGKDYTKVDRSAAYYARYIAKNIVAAGLAKKCEIGVSYAIGISKPVMISLNTFDTGIYSDSLLLKAIKNLFTFTPQEIIDTLNLKFVSFKDATYNYHFENNTFPWERLNIKNKLKMEADRIYLSNFESKYSTKSKKEEVLKKMSNSEIKKLIEASPTTSGKIFYTKFLKKTCMNTNK